MFHKFTLHAKSVYPIFAPNIISSLQASNEISELSGENLYPLTATQSQQLAVVKQFFPKASDGLGRTSLIEHTIEVGNALPVKQRFYPVSPAVEKLLYATLTVCYSWMLLSLP